MSATTFGDAAALIAKASVDTVPLRVAYSVKTNPRRELLHLARRQGFYAEVISDPEFDWAISNGFERRAIIYNGPRPLRKPGNAVHVAFADSLVAFEAYAKGRIAEIIGVRLRPQGIASRFGVPQEDFDDLLACATRLQKDLEFGVSFHVRPEDFAGRSWRDIAGNVLHSAAKLERHAGHPVAVLDFGGGWTPEAFRNALVQELPETLSEARRTLPHLREVFLEPGQALATPCVALFSRVLEIRSMKNGVLDVVIDGSIHDAPHIDAYPHQIFAGSTETLRRLSHGRDRLLGCACLEYDILASHVSLPRTLAVGDLVVIADCGSYDSSMSFVFARGGASESAYASV